MIDNNNILLITDNDDIAKQITEKLILLRENDNITVCDYSCVKKSLSQSLYCVIIIHESDNKQDTLKTITNIKDVKPEAEIILLLNDNNPQLILEAYDRGIYDYFLTDTDDYEMLIKTVNCFKMRLLKEIQTRNEKFLYQLGIIDSKTNLYNYKYLKEIFVDISDNLRIQNGIFAILTLDERTKTKVSTNRLANAIKNSVRGDDIIAVARGGKFYMILPNIDLEGTKNLISKIQDKMGSDFTIRAGLSKIGIQSFETLDKNTQDALTSAILNERTTACLDSNNKIKDSWLEDDVENNKNFKLFNVAFTNKMNNVITPIFFRYQKEFETKLINTTVSQYTNSIECVFCLKNDNFRSELVIRYNGFTKFLIEINHSGLESAENSRKEISLSQMSEKFLSAELKRLKTEYKNTLAEMNTGD